MLGLNMVSQHPVGKWVGKKQARDAETLYSIGESDWQCRTES